jgi:hypothetical protein
MRLLLRAPLVALVLTSVLAVSAAVAPPPVRAAAGISIETGARYVVVPGKGVVRVTVDIDAANQKPNSSNGGAVTRYYYDAVNIGVQPEARNLRATQDGVPTRVEASPRPGYRLVTVHFRSSIFYGQRASVRLQFDLPGGKPRSASDVRVGKAFVSFLAWAFGDSGTVRVEIPPGFEVDVSGEEMRRTTTEGGVQVYRANASTALTWYAWINGRNDRDLTRRAVELANGETVLVRAWPEDTRWRGHVAGVLSDGIPALAERIGLPWPVKGELSVLEIHTPLLEGYAGFYDPETDRITVTEELDDVTIVHEASHAWFNQHLFDERWITEGLAETYAADVVRSIGGNAPGPRAVAPDDPHAFALDDWPPPAPIRNDDAGDREQFGYDAAYTVMSQIVDAAGDDGMRRVFEAASAGTTAYVGDAPPERTTLAGNDWRRFLDLTEQVGGARGVAALLKTWALTPEDAGLLPARATARRAYASLVADGGHWAAPLGVRTAMDGWAFDDAQAEMSAASDILDRWASVEQLAATEGLHPPAGIEAAYEGAASATAIRDVASMAADSEASLKTVVGAADAVEAPRDWLVQLGLQGKDPDGELAAARTAWEAGSYADASSLAAAAAGTLAVAPDAGRGRALVIGGSVGLVLLLLVVLLTMRRRRLRRRRAIREAREAVALAAGEEHTAILDGDPAPRDEIAPSDGAVP